MPVHMLIHMSALMSAARMPVQKAIQHAPEEQVIHIPGGFDHNARFSWTDHRPPSYRRIMNTDPITDPITNPTANPNPTTYKPNAANALAARRQQVWAACRAANMRMPISHITALSLWKIELPSRCPLSQRELHATVSSPGRRRRAKGVRMHSWQGLRRDHVLTSSDGLLILSKPAIWALMAGCLDIGQLAALAESLIRHGDLTADGLKNFVETEPVPYPRKCMDALALTQPGSDSPKETELRLCLYAHGLPKFAVNYAVPGVAYENGAPITLDLAMAHLAIGIEYDGDHHRTDKDQWRRDLWKRQLLERHGWRIIVATQLDLSDAWHRVTFCMNVATAIAERSGGTAVALSRPLSWSAMVDRRRRFWKTGG